MSEEVISPVSQMPPTFPLHPHHSLAPSQSSSSSHSSRSHSPRRLYTAPQTDDVEKPRAFKRIAVFCDGTWDNGVTEGERSGYTNVLRLARSVHHEDTRTEGEPPIMQIVFYQPGIGSNDNLYSKYVEGSTGSSLGDKVEQAYAFIAHNFNPGDEVFIFGFSRGAYTARMVAMFIGAIGILSRADMDYFANIFISFQKLEKCKEMDIKEKKSYEDFLAKYRKPDSDGHRRAGSGKDKFTVKCVGVWDTVGSLGLPHEIPHTELRISFFGFPDCQLGEHIEAAYQALAIDEMREDFNCTKFNQTSIGKKKGQILKQTWFSGCHADIGGGYKEHDLSDITLIWMAANVEHSLYLDPFYLQKRICDPLSPPIAPWGAQKPHDARKGIFKLTDILHRTLPTAPNPDTHETIHISVLERINSKFPAVAAAIKAHPTLVAEIQPLEDQFRELWPYDATHPNVIDYTSKLNQKQCLTLDNLGVWFNTLVRSVSFQSISSFHSTRWGGQSRSISVSSDSTQLANVEGTDEEMDRADVKMAKSSSVTYTSIGEGNGRKTMQVNTVVKSVSLVIQSPTL